MILIVGGLEIAAGGTTTVLAAGIIPWLCGAYAHSTWYFTCKSTMSLPLAFAAGALGSLVTYEWLDGFPRCRTALAKISSMAFISRSGFIFAHLIIVSISRHIYTRESRTKGFIFIALVKLACLRTCSLTGSVYFNYIPHLV